MFTYFLCLLFVASSLAINCPNGFAELNNNTCYQVFNDPATFVDANVHCSQLGGSLLSIHNFIDNRLITNLASSNIFLGLQCDSTSQCQWEDKTIFEFLNFQSQVPQNNEKCVILQAGTGVWSRSSCESKNSYVCVVKTTSTENHYTLQATTDSSNNACGVVEYYAPPSTIKYPYIYGLTPANNTCMYKVSTAFGKKIAIYFEYYTLNEGSSIVVYDGANTNALPIVSFGSGYNSSLQYKSTANYVLLQLNTLSSNDNFHVDVQTVR